MVFIYRMLKYLILSKILLNLRTGCEYQVVNLLHSASVSVLQIFQVINFLE